ncbi:hypothetical protein ES705_24470 [subsurface metagenome]
MEERIEQELNLLRKYYPDLKVDEGKRWILLPGYTLPKRMAWNKDVIDICIEIRPGYPGTHPYGIYVPADLRYDGQELLNWQPKANNQPSFFGNWAMISWSPEGQWKPGSDVVKGFNMLNFVLSFVERFKEGR